MTLNEALYAAQSALLNNQTSMVEGHGYRIYQTVATNLVSSGWQDGRWGMKWILHI